MARSKITQMEVIDLPNEQWSAIDGFTQIYMISNVGRIKTFNIYTGREYCLKPQICGGYQFVRLYTEDGKGHTQYIHRLVGSAFCEGYDETRHDIDHIDTIRTNNHYSNLRWVTESENSLNPITLAKNSTSVLQCAQDGYVIALWPSIRQAKINTGVSESSIISSSEHRRLARGFYWLLRKPIKHRNK